MAEDTALLDRLAALEVLVSAQVEKLEPPQLVQPDPSRPPRFSVITPTRNRASDIVQAIRSVTSQTLTDWEMIIVDDGSTDETDAAVRPFLADPRLRYEKREPGGPGAARNHALSLAQGTLIAYLDSDNRFFPNFLAGMAAAFDADPPLQCAYGILVANGPVDGESRILWRRFDRERLRVANFIDLGAFVHRRTLVESLGGFDESLTRLIDWDLIQRYTAEAATARVPLPAVRYNTCSQNRVTDTADFGSNWFRVRRKMLPPLPRPMRVLYAIWHYPQLTETYIETELRALKRAGVKIEVWSEKDAEVPGDVVVPTRKGSLADAIRIVRPDIVHIHWLNFGKYADIAQAAGVPVTIRAHGFETTRESVAKALAHPNIKRMFLSPFQDISSQHNDARIQRLATPFDTTLFSPSANKDRRMILRTSAALRSKELEFFLELSKRLPDHRFVLVACRCLDAVDQFDWLVEKHRTSGSPAELKLNVPRSEVAALMAQAGIYVHTAVPPGVEWATPIGMPISIAEAMATGSHVLVRNLPPLAKYIGNAGSVYRDIDDATRIIAESADWSPAEWRRRELAAIDRAFLHHADDMVVRPIIDAWNDIIASRPRPEGRIESLKTGEISGWVWNAAEPNSALRVSVMRDGAVVQSAMADIFRDDLLRAGKGDGRHGFRIILSPAQPEEIGSITCRVDVMGFNIPRLSPRPDRVGPSSNCKA